MVALERSRRDRLRDRRIGQRLFAPFSATAVERIGLEIRPKGRGMLFIMRAACTVPPIPLLLLLLQPFNPFRAAVPVWGKKYSRIRVVFVPKTGLRF